MTKKLRPNFWKDQLWLFPVLIICFHAVFTIFFSIASPNVDAIIMVNVMIVFLLDSIFWLMFFDNISNTIYFEPERVIFRGLLWKKIIPYKDIQGIIASASFWPSLTYIDHKNQRSKIFHLFVWCHSVTEIIRELEQRRGKFTNYNEAAVLKIANNNRWSKIWTPIIIILVLTGTLLALHFDIFVKK